ncbi:MAG TPA: DUF58 domain-containing protein [Mycobacteriales bacterium]|nr:DUF58 domain-containing protein [Mycobacteriales bacterium]
MADRPAGWRPTAAYSRAVGVGGALLLGAVLLRRPDLVVLAAPLLVGAALAVAGRPAAGPELRLSVPPRAALEGGRVVVTATVTAPDGVDVAAVVLAVPLWLDPETGGVPPAAALPVPAGGGPVPVEFPLIARRWGRRQVGPATLHATAAHGLLSWPPVTTVPLPTATWPLRADFAAGDVVPRAEGLLGGHPSRRPGEGSDVAGVRPFVPGDRLHRINWRVTGRTGTLHVTSTYADRDTEVLLVLDSRQDLGRSPDSSLDTGVRAAAAVAEHYLRAGDRVGLADLGQRHRVVPARAGRRHLVRLLDLLLNARVVDDRTRAAPPDAEVVGRVGPDALVVLLSPLAREAVLGLVARLARAGRSVVVVDTLPPALRPDERGEYTELAFRLWRLRRDADLHRLTELGVPVVRWQGGGSLDAVLRDVRRVARAPRVVR